MFESSEDEDEEEAVPEGYVDPEDEMDGPATSAPPPAAPPPVAAPIPGAAAGGAPSLLEYFRAANPNAMDTSVRDILLAEGPCPRFQRRLRPSIAYLPSVLTCATYRHVDQNQERKGKKQSATLPLNRKYLLVLRIERRGADRQSQEN